MRFPKPARRSRSKPKPIRRTRTLGAKRREAKAADSVDPDTWDAIVVWYGYRCGVCGAPWQQQGHAISLAHGGKHCARNVFPICTRCNMNSGTRTVYPRKLHPYGMAQEAEK